MTALVLILCLASVQGGQCADGKCARVAKSVVKAPVVVTQKAVKSTRYILKWRPFGRVCR